VIRAADGTRSGFSVELWGWFSNSNIQLLLKFGTKATAARYGYLSSSTLGGTSHRFNPRSKSTVCSTRATTGISTCVDF